MMVDLACSTFLAHVLRIARAIGHVMASTLTSRELQRAAPVFVATFRDESLGFEAFAMLDAVNVALDSHIFSLLGAHELLATSALALDSVSVGAIRVFVDRVSHPRRLRDTTS